MSIPSGQLFRVSQVIQVARESHMVALMCLLVFLWSCGNDTREDHGSEAGVLRIHPSNPRWLTNDGGNAIYLTGVSGGTNPNASFNCLQDIDFDSTPDNFDTTAAFVAEVAAGRNFVRCWNMQQTAWGSAAEFSGNTYWRIPLNQMPWKQVGSRMDSSSGTAITVGIYDLTQYNQVYFDRVRAHVLAALNAGLTSSIQVFSAGHYTFQFSGFSNPFLAANNVNSISCDVTTVNGNCEEMSTIVSSVNGTNMLAAEDNYVKKLIDTLNDLDGIIWELSNESQNGVTYGTYASLDFLNHIADTITTFEAQGGRQAHLIWMSPYPNSTFAGATSNTHVQITSPACVTGETFWDTNPTANAGKKTVNVWFYDSDHTGGAGACGTEVSGWPWAQFTRGYYPIFLDERESADVRTTIKQQMAQTLVYANKMHLAGMAPETGNSIISTGYGLYEACKEYLMFQPSAATNNIDLTSCAGQFFTVEYLDPATGAVTTDTDVSGGESRNFSTSAMRVVYLKRRQPM
jgi:hypothetical protein